MQAEKVTCARKTNGIDNQELRKCHIYILEFGIWSYILIKVGIWSVGIWSRALLITTKFQVYIYIYIYIKNVMTKEWNDIIACTSVDGKKIRTCPDRTLYLAEPIRINNR